MPSAGSISSRGFVWSTNSNPTVNDNYINVDGQIGTFQSQLGRQFTPNTTYYIRAYASSDFGFKYGSEMSVTTNTLPSLGDFYAGGFVFDINTSSNYILVASEEDDTNRRWANNLPFDVQTTNSDGYNNTLNMHAAGSPLAGGAINHNAGGYNDWYVPSVDELKLMYDRSNHAGGNFYWNNHNNGDRYWSSTERPNFPNEAQAVGFYSGGIAGFTKTNSLRVRYIRKTSYN